MGQGGIIFCEWDSIQEEVPHFQETIRNLENDIIKKCNADWKPKTLGYMSVGDDQYGETSILPALFNDNAGVQMAHWRQHFAAAGNQTLITGAHTGSIIPEDFKVGWYGLAFPNEEQNITELRWQISNNKYGRVNIEAIKSFNKPAIVFDQAFILNEEQAFELYGYLEEADYQRIVMLGVAFFKIIDKVLGAPGAVL